MMEYEDPLFEGLDSNDLENMSLRFNPARGIVGIHWKAFGEPERMRIIRMEAR